jgi:hypothetical protein
MCYLTFNLTGTRPLEPESARLFPKRSSRMATLLVATFLGQEDAWGTGVHSLLGDTFNGIVGSDRGSADNWIEPIGRALLTQAKEPFRV